MFTGIIQHKGRIGRLEPVEAGLAISVLTCGWGHRPTPGDSIAVSGVCLTVAGGADADELVFHAVRETLSKTTLGDFHVGGEVNLEHACRADTLMGGHIVQGHVDGVGRVCEVRADPADWRIEVEPPEELMPYMVPKGSVAIDGVSLTIASVTERSFRIALIPTTLEKTTLGTLRSGDRVNIETDVIARTVVNYMRNYLERPLAPQG